MEVCSTSVVTQGADTVIYERLDPHYALNASMKESTNKHMEDYGSSGLRTLCLAWTEVDKAAYDTCVHACVRACLRACMRVCVCVCVWECVGDS